MTTIYGAVRVDHAADAVVHMWRASADPESMLLPADRFVPGGDWPSVLAALRDRYPDPAPVAGADPPAARVTAGADWAAAALLPRLAAVRTAADAAARAAAYGPLLLSTASGRPDGQARARLLACADYADSPVICRVCKGAYGYYAVVADPGAPAARRRRADGAAARAAAKRAEKVAAATARRAEYEVYGAARDAVEDSVRRFAAVAGLARVVAAYAEDAGAHERVLAARDFYKKYVGRVGDWRLLPAVGRYFELLRAAGVPGVAAGSELAARLAAEGRAVLRAATGAARSGKGLT